MRRALKGRSSQDAPPGLDAEASQWLLLEGDRGCSGLVYVSPKLVPCRIPLGFHNKAVRDERRRGAPSCVRRKTTSPYELLYDWSRPRCNERNQIDHQRHRRLHLHSDRCSHPGHLDTRMAWTRRALGDERNTLVEALGVYVKQGSDSVARALSGDLLIGLSRVGFEALAKVADVSSALVDVMVAPPATASRAALRLHAVSIAGDFQDCGAALRRASPRPPLRDRRRPPRLLRPLLSTRRGSAPCLQMMRPCCRRPRIIGDAPT